MSVAAEETVQTWADQWAPVEPIDPPQPDPGPDRTRLGLAMILVVGLALGGAAFLALSGALDTDSNPNIDTEVAGATSEAPATTEATTATTEAAATTTEPAATTEAPATTVEQAPDTEAPATTAAQVLVPSVGDDDVRTAVFKGGKVYLRGEVPSQDIADVIATRAGAVVGPENVVVEYVINPDAALPDSAPLYVDDKVLFEVNSSTINPGFVPLLDLGTSLMLQTDSVTMTVIAHTDSVGSAEYNQTLSEDRAQAVKDFWIEAGIAPERIEAIGMGESSPEGDNLVGEGRAANRRAEFIVHGILG